MWEHPTDMWLGFGGNFLQLWEHPVSHFGSPEGTAQAPLIPAQWSRLISQSSPENQLGRLLRNSFLSQALLLLSALMLDELKVGTPAVFLPVTPPPHSNERTLLANLDLGPSGCRKEGHSWITGLGGWGGQGRCRSSSKRNEGSSNWGWHLRLPKTHPNIEVSLESGTIHQAAGRLWIWAKAAQSWYAQGQRGSCLA